MRSADAQTNQPGLRFMCSQLVWNWVNAGVPMLLSSAPSVPSQPCSRSSCCWVLTCSSSIKYRQVRSVSYIYCIHQVTMQGWKKLFDNSLNFVRPQYNLTGHHWMLTWHISLIRCTIITYSVYKNMWKVQKYIMSALCGHCWGGRWCGCSFTVAWTMDQWPGVFGPAYCTLVSYCRQTMHQSIGTRDLSWLSISARSHHHNRSQTDASSCVSPLPLVECLLWHLPFDASFSRRHLSSIPQLPFASSTCSHFDYSALFFLHAVII